MQDGFGGDLFRYNNKQKYAVIDFETCNLNLISQENKPWQVGVTEFEGPKFKRCHDIYVNWPDLKVSEGAAIVTGFDPEIVKSKGKDPKKILDWLDEKFIYNPDYIILWYNGLNFDIYIHNLWRKSFGKPTDYSYIKRTIDVHCLYKAYKLGIKFKNEEDFLGWQYRFVNVHARGMKTNLQAACKEFDIVDDYNKEGSQPNFHDGAYDTRMTGYLFWALVKQLDL